VASIRSRTVPLAAVGLQDFVAIRHLGKGGYGEVLLVSHTGSGKLFAVKQIPKEVKVDAPLDTYGRPMSGDRALRALAVNQERATRRQVDYLVQERSGLEAVRHPYVLHLTHALQDDSYWYLFTEYCEGGELYQWSLKQPHKHFCEPVVRVWAAQLVSAIEHMHQLGYLHRDIKPENILLDKHGDARLADFGFVKRLAPTERASTFCGTKYYIPPEMLRGDGSYTHAVDWWALGVLLYELLLGRPPFYNKNRQVLFHKIVHDAVAFPERAASITRSAYSVVRDTHSRASVETNGGAANESGASSGDVAAVAAAATSCMDQEQPSLSDEARSLIGELLAKYPSKRLGSRDWEQARSVLDSADAKARGVTTEIRPHPFFASVNWREVDAGMFHLPAPALSAAQALVAAAAASSATAAAAASSAPASTQRFPQPLSKACFHAQSASSANKGGSLYLDLEGFDYVAPDLLDAAHDASFDMAHDEQQPVGTVTTDAPSSGRAFTGSVASDSSPRSISVVALPPAMGTVELKQAAPHHSSHEHEDDQDRLSAVAISVTKIRPVPVADLAAFAAATPFNTDRREAVAV